MRGLRPAPEARVRRPRATPERGSLPAPSRGELLLLLAVVAVLSVGLLWLGRSQWFFLDEFDFLIDRRASSLDGLLRPHNEHLSLLPVLVLRAVFAVAGLTTYTPYYALLVGVHAAAVVLSYLVMRRGGVPQPPALAASVLLMLYASGAQNILWANQISLIGSLAFFFGAVLVLRPEGSVRRHLAAAALLAASLACSGVGVSACVGIAIALILGRRGLRAFALVVGPPVGLYIAWFAAYGRSAETPQQLSLFHVLDRSPLFVLRAAAHALDGLVAGVRGEGDGPGFALLVLLVGALAIAVVLSRGRLPFIPAACLGMCLALYASTAVVRVGLDPELALAGRYAYLGAFLLVPAVLALGASYVPVRARSRAFGVTALALLLAVPINAFDLRRAAHEQAAYETGLRDLTAQAGRLVGRGMAYLNDAPVDPRLAPAFSVAELAELQASDRLERARPEAPVGSAAAALTMLTTYVRPGSTDSAAFLDLTRAVGAGAVSRRADCVQADGAEASGFLVFRYSNAGSVVVRPGAALSVRLYVGPSPDFVLGGFVDRPVQAGRDHVLELADPKGVRYVRVELAGPIVVCGVRAGPIPTE